MFKTQVLLLKQKCVKDEGAAHQYSVLLICEVLGTILDIIKTKKTNIAIRKIHYRTKCFILLAGEKDCF